MTEPSQQQQHQQELLGSMSENANSSSSRSRLTNPIKPKTKSTVRKPSSKMQSRRSSFSSFASSIATTTTTSSSSTSGFLMKWLPSRRRQSEEVKRTSLILDDYTNVLSRDSNFLASSSSVTSTTPGGGGGTDAATVSSGTGTTLSLNEEQSSVRDGGRPSIVTVATTVGSFQRQEVSLGALLGKGRFSKVYEITSIELEDHLDNNNNDEDNMMMDDDDASERRARTTMSKNAKAGQYAMKRLRKKLLRGRPRDFTKAAANLVIEAEYLSRLSHPNIVKLRGSALGGASAFQSGEHDNYFLILDRVTETLSDRIHNTWALSRRTTTTTTSSILVDESELLHKKVALALQLSSAISYLHEHRIIYRALCPNSIGFLANNTIDNANNDTLQLFDFGLARDLPSALGLPNELYHLTQNAGHSPYAATEVATTGLYNLKADVYSWSMVVYEMMMEQVPFAHLARKGNNSKKPFANKDFVQAVYIDGERPSFSAAGDDENNNNGGGEGKQRGAAVLVSPPPQELQDLLISCWNSDLFHRPTMEEVHFQLEGILESKSLQLGMIPPAPTKVTNIVLETNNKKDNDGMTRQRSGLSFSDLTNNLEGSNLD